MVNVRFNRLHYVNTKLNSDPNICMCDCMAESVLIRCVVGSHRICLTFEIDNKEKCIQFYSPK